MNLREWALPVYTILMQLAVGSMSVLWILRAFLRSAFSKKEIEQALRNPVAVILITITCAMLGSFFHLSRPYLSFLAVRNIANSWLSREIFFTVLLFGAIVLLWLLQAFGKNFWHIKSALGWTVVLFGLSATYCMTRLYLLPSQASWNTPFTVWSFYSSLVLLGATASLTMLAVDMQYTIVLNPQKLSRQQEIIKRSLPVNVMIAVAAYTAIFIQYIVLFQTLCGGDATAQASLILYQGLYQPLLILRLLAGFAGITWMVISYMQIYREKMPVQRLAFHAYMTCLLLLVSEILGRFLFYATHVRQGF